MSEEYELEAPVEDLEVRVWEFDHFVALGFDAEQATSLVEARVSWHEAERLIKGGCSVKTAYRLLRP